MASVLVRLGRAMVSGAIFFTIWRGRRRSGLVGIFQEHFPALVRLGGEKDVVVLIEEVVDGDVGLFVGDDALEKLDGGGVDAHLRIVIIGRRGNGLAHGALDGDLQVGVDVFAQERRRRRFRRHRLRPSTRRRS